MINYSFLIDDALKEGNGNISPEVQELLTDIVVGEGVDRQAFLDELRKKTSDYFRFVMPSETEDKHKCSNCGANIPVVAYYCDYCGAKVADGIHSNLTDSQMISEITAFTEKLKKAPKPGFFSGLFYNLYLIFPAMWLCVVVMALTIEDFRFQNLINTSFPILSVASIIAIIVRIVSAFRSKGKRLNETQCKSEVQKISNRIRIYFGDNSNIFSILSGLHEEVKMYLSALRLRKIFNTAVHLLIIIGVTGFITMIYSIAQKDFTIDDYAGELKPFYESRQVIKSITTEIEGPLKNYLKVVDADYMSYFDVISPSDYRMWFELLYVKFEVIKPMIIKKGAKPVDYLLQMDFQIKDNQTVNTLYPQFNSKPDPLMYDNAEYLRGALSQKNFEFTLPFSGDLTIKKDSASLADFFNKLEGFKIISLQKNE